jgi:hypothetical protein
LVERVETEVHGYHEARRRQNTLKGAMAIFDGKPWDQQLSHSWESWHFCSLQAFADATVPHPTWPFPGGVLPPLRTRTDNNPGAVARRGRDVEHGFARAVAASLPFSPTVVYQPPAVGSAAAAGVRADVQLLFPGVATAFTFDTSVINVASASRERVQPESAMNGVRQTKRDRYRGAYDWFVPYVVTLLGTPHPLSRAGLWSVCAKATEEGDASLLGMGRADTADFAETTIRRVSMAVVSAAARWAWTDVAGGAAGDDPGRRMVRGHDGTGEVLSAERNGGVGGGAEAGEDERMRARGVIW